MKRAVIRFIVKDKEYKISLFCDNESLSQTILALQNYNCLLQGIWSTDVEDKKTSAEKTEVLKSNEEPILI